MPQPHVVIEDPAGDRATVHPDALPMHEASGFKALGEAVGPGVLQTVEEAEAAAAQAAGTVPADEQASNDNTPKSGRSAATTKKEK